MIKLEEVKEKPKKEKVKYTPFQTFAFMLKQSWSVSKSVPFVCLLSAGIMVVLNLLWLFIAPAILDKVETAAPLSELLLTILVFAGLLIIVQGALNYLSSFNWFPRIEIRMSILKLIAHKFSSTSFPNVEDTKVKEKSNHAQNITNGNSAATEAVWYSYTDLARDTAGFIIYIIMLSGLDVFLMLTVIVTAVIGFIVSNRLNGYGYRHRDEEASYANRIWYFTGLANQSRCAKDIRIFGMKPWLTSLYEKSVDLYRDFLTRAEKVYIWSDITDLVLTFLRNGIAYFYLIKMVLDGGLSAAEFLFYFSAFSGFTNWITGILNDCSTINRHSRDLSILLEYLDTPEPFTFAGGKDVPTADGYEITLKNVTFRYPEAESDTLKNINLTVHAGEKLAVVGLNGAGKTTLVKLICGFYDPTEGEVLLNGEDIRKFDRRKYYDIFSAVFQESQLIDITVSENVSLHILPETDGERVKNCIEKAGLTEKINSLPNGLNTYIGREVFLDGVELSGGERQRMFLARALYKDAPVIVLDEPTAALDPIAENDMYMKYNDMTKGKTSVYISHRLASTRFCDRIILIDGGVIAEEGTHAQLMEKKGKYAELFEVQSRYYRKGGNFNER